jgi:hypothetical protein
MRLRGRADDKTGEAVKLVIVKKDPDLTEAQVREYCNANLTGYKQPKVIEFRTDLPKTPVGKILRRELRDSQAPDPADDRAGTNPLAVVARMTRSAMLEVLGEDYIRTARAKGLPPLRVIGVHALRNALIPVITVIGLQVGVLFTGAILTETIFSWPGVGKWLIEAINRRDYPVLQGGMLLLGVVVMSVNLLVDVTYGMINPRIRQQGH